MAVRHKHAVAFGESIATESQIFSLLDVVKAMGDSIKEIDEEIAGGSESQVPNDPALREMARILCCDSKVQPGVSFPHHTSLSGMVLMLFSTLNKAHPMDSLVVLEQSVQGKKLIRWIGAYFKVKELQDEMEGEGGYKDYSSVFQRCVWFTENEDCGEDD